MKSSLPRMLTLLLAPLAVSISSAAPPPGPDPVYRQRGYWEARYDWGTAAAHMALLRGTDTHSQVIFWWGESDVRVWKWNPGDVLSGASILLNRPAPGSNIHCAGESFLVDGRLLVTAGTETNGTSFGFDQTCLYDPATTQWTLNVAQMNHPRWYPTNTTLADGTVLVTSGRMYREFVLFGGRSAAGVGSGLDVFGLRGIAQAFPVPATPSPPVPPRREDHTAVFDAAITTTDANGFRPFQRFVVFGGPDSAAQALGDLWVLTRNELSDWTWTESTPAADASHGTPAARSDHAAVADRPDTSMVFFGGRGAAGQALDDAWKIHLSRGPMGRWTKLLAAGGDSTLARYGHTAVYDAAQRRLIMFGGRNGAAYYNDVWSLSLSGSPQWTKITPTGTPPAARCDHTAIFDAGRNRMVVYGGFDGAQSLSDVRLLTFTSPTAAAWSTLSPAADPTHGTPVARHRSAAIHDLAMDRLIICGGDSGLASPEPLGDYWHLTFTDPVQWRRHPDVTLAGGRSGHAGVYDTRYLNAAIPELYDPETNVYQILPSAEKWLPLYPCIYLLPGGKLFLSAPVSQTHILDPVGWTWQTYPWSQSGFSGFTSVMYRPGLIMKSGGPGSVGSSPAKRINLSGDLAAASWQPVAASPPLRERIVHNMTLLPNGDVIAVGGMQNLNDVTSATRAPQIWSPFTDFWTDSTFLAPDVAVRDYHSSSILLPDGRILSAGGDISAGPGGRDRYTATIYWPPCLFDSAGNIAPRPEVATLDTVLTHGQPFTLCSPDADRIAGVALLRPSATTHGIDMEQRFIPIPFTRNGTCLSLTAPPDGNTAPPGYYLIYAVNQDSVPSIGRWVHLDAASVSGLPIDGDRNRPTLFVTPNPVRSRAEIHFVLPADAGPDTPIALRVHDARGRLVRILDPPARAPGPARIAWDTLDDRGRRVPAGVYFVRLSMPGLDRVGRAIVVR